MKTFPGTLGADYEKAVTTFARLLKLKRHDGLILGFTGHDQDLPYDDGSGDGEITYKSKLGLDGLATQQSLGYRPDGAEISFVIDDAAITVAELAAGLWDHAEYTIYEINYEDRTTGRHYIPDGGRGWIGAVSLRGQRGDAQMRPLSDAYSIEKGRTVGRKCIAPFGDAVLCGVRLEAPFWAASTAVSVVNPRRANVGSIVRPNVFNDRIFECTTAGTTGAVEPTWNTTIDGTTSDGTAEWTARQAYLIEAVVDAVTDKRNFTVTVSTDAPDAFLTRGRVRFTSGPNAAARPMDIKAWSLAGKSIELMLPMPFTISPGETLDIFAGCPKTRAGCKARRNIEHAIAFFDVPGNDEVYKVNTEKTGGGKK